MTRDIDARVAREVMGWRTREAYDEVYIFMDRELADPRSGANTLSPVMGFEGGYLFIIPRYSTDMNAAMEAATAVVAKLGGTIEMVLEEGGWWVVFKVRPGCWHGWKDKTLSRAICLAALEAVESDR